MNQLNGDLRNWSGRMSLLAEVQLEVAYYNAKLGLWEPVVEPVCWVSSSGAVNHRRWTIDLRYQVSLLYHSFLYLYMSLLYILLLYISLYHSSI